LMYGAVDDDLAVLQRESPGIVQKKGNRYRMTGAGIDDHRPKREER